MDPEKPRTQNLIVPTDPTTLVFPKIRDVKLISTLSDRIDVWTNGQPFLTYLIHHYLNQYSAQIVSSEGPTIIDEIVSQKIVKDWRQNEAATHLIAIEKAILAHPLKDELLILYMRFLWLETRQPEVPLPTQTRIQLNQSGERSILLRTGLLTRKKGHLNKGNLTVANAVYSTIFSQDWLEAQLPGITRTVSISSTNSVSTTASKHLDDEHSIKDDQRSGEQLTPKKQPGVFSSKWFNQHFTQRHLTQQHFTTHQYFTQYLTSLRSPALFTSTSQHLTAPHSTSPHSTFSRTFSNGSYQSLKLFAVLCGVLLSIATLAHAQKEDIQQHELSDRTPERLSDRELYQQGMNHATNARWITALQKFCQIPSESAYFSVANQQLSQWVLLYPDDLQKANNGLRLKKNKPCRLAEEALSASEAEHS